MKTKITFALAAILGMLGLAALAQYQPYIGTGNQTPLPGPTNTVASGSTLNAPFLTGRISIPGLHKDGMIGMDSFGQLANLYAGRGLEVHDGVLNFIGVTSYVVYTNQPSAPTPEQIGAGNGAHWVSNTILYYSYTANGTTSNNAVKLAP